MTDKLVKGPFGSDACYQQTFETDGQEITTWMCMGSGFTTSTLMTSGSKLHNDLLETSPELYKDLLHIDENNRVWSPATITLPEKGMVFLDGRSAEDWQWAAVKVVEVTEEERKSKNFPKDQTHRMDMQNVQHFGKNDFMDACDAIGFFSA